MGYTHYWTNIEATNIHWDAFIKDVKHVISLSKIELKVEANDSSSVDSWVFINGVGDDAHEDLYIQKEISRSGNFCKTARKPYDAIVCAVLHLYEYHCGDKVHIQSDGYLSDEGWLVAYQLILREFGVEYLTGCYYRRRSTARKILNDSGYTLPVVNDLIVESLYFFDEPQDQLPPLGDNDSWCGPDEDKVEEVSMYEQLHKMEIHDTMSIPDWNIIRVVGGWIYRPDSSMVQTVPLFVPEV